MEVWSLTLAAVLFVSMVSFIGAAAGAAWLRRHGVIMALVALAAGSLLGDAALHLLPESSELWEGVTPAVGGLVLAGFCIFFVLEGALRAGHAHGEAIQEDHGHGEHKHHHPARATKPGRRVAPFAWMNIVGDGVHNFLDGIVLAAAFSVDLALGLATTVAVILHEIPQELGDFAVLLRGGMNRREALGWNFASACMSIAGAVGYLLLPFDSEVMERYALPLTAGGFLYIAAADLVPELHHHARDRHMPVILLGFVAGLGAMAALLVLE